MTENCYTFPSSPSEKVTPFFLSNPLLKIEMGGGGGGGGGGAGAHYVYFHVNCEYCGHVKFYLFYIRLRIFQTF